ncbi:MAG: hypothetical protein A2V67_06700 [Deltaproteobacteria bacterium RBG_13_61_14]|nr:MAG: hypothetical protein A2V67_06700 [Deltaproteobacteria bacterium RBG_13_61_14]
MNPARVLPAYAPAQGVGSPSLATIAAKDVALALVDILLQIFLAAGLDLLPERSPLCLGNRHRQRAVEVGHQGDAD